MQSSVLWFVQRHRTECLQLSLHFPPRPVDADRAAYLSWTVRGTQPGQANPLPPELESVALWKYCLSLNLASIADSLFLSAQTLKYVVLWGSGKETGWTIDRQREPLLPVELSTKHLQKLKGSMFT